MPKALGTHNRRTKEVEETVIKIRPTCQKTEEDAADRQQCPGIAPV